MSYILKKVEVNGDADMYGGSNGETKIAISLDIENLKMYCVDNFNSEATIGKPETFSWEYYTIVESSLIIL